MAEVQCKRVTNGDEADGPALKKTKLWSVPSSEESKGAINSIRQCEERHFKEPLEKRDESKELIKLSIGNKLSNQPTVQQL